MLTGRLKYAKSSGWEALVFVAFWLLNLGVHRSNRLFTGDAAKASGVPRACIDLFFSRLLPPAFSRQHQRDQVVITSGTLSPLDLYPKLLGFNPVVRTALSMSTVRKCICPLVVTR